MGACYGRLGGIRNRGAGTGAARTAHPSVKTQPLKNDIIKWKSEMPITLGQLKSQQDAFWETCVVFEGRKEIWDAIRAAVNAAEESEFGLAQAIVDGANIYIPHGNLTEAYDELGNQYKVPIYCLSLPVNILCEDHTSPCSPPEEDNWSVEVEKEDDHFLKLRLSSSAKDVELRVRKEDSVASSKLKLGRKVGYEGRQRWFYGGKLLEDKLKVNSSGVPPSHIIQVVFLEVPPDS